MFPTVVIANAIVVC